MYKYVYVYRDLSLKVKHVPFNHFYEGSNPLDLINTYGYRLMVDQSSSKRFVPIQIRLAVKG